MKRKLEIFAIGSFTACLIAGCSAVNPSVGSRAEKTIFGASPDTLYVDKSKRNPDAETWKGFPVWHATFKGMLRRISVFENVSYVYDGEDFPLPDSPNYRITSFDDLKRYVRDATEFSVEEKRRKFVKSGIVPVEVRYRKDNPFIMPFKTEILGESTLMRIFDRLSDVTGYEIYVDSDLDEEFGEKLGRFAFRGKTLYDFFKYVEKAKNVFIKIDPKNKRMEITRYDTETYDLPVYDLKDDVNLVYEGSNGKNTVKVSSYPYEDLKRDIEFLVGKGNYVVNPTLGTLTVRVDRARYENVIKKIDDYMATASIPIRVTFRVYEVDLKSPWTMEKIREDMENRDVWLTEDFDLNLRTFAMRYGKINMIGTYEAKTVNGVPVSFKIGKGYIHVKPKYSLTDNAVTAMVYTPFSGTKSIFRIDNDPDSEKDVVVSGEVSGEKAVFVSIGLRAIYPGYREYQYDESDRLFGKDR